MTFSTLETQDDVTTDSDQILIELPDGLHEQLAERAARLNVSAEALLLDVLERFADGFSDCEEIAEHLRGELGEELDALDDYGDDENVILQLEISDSLNDRITDSADRLGIDWEDVAAAILILTLEE